jgi:DNA helicase IV
MRARAAAFAERDDLAANRVDAGILQVQFADRARSLTDAIKGQLCFGRIDDARERLYIGRTHVEDENTTPLVVDWRARAAIPFYRATFADPMDLNARRRFILEQRALVDIMEEDFLDPDSATVGTGGVPDPLLAELGRARTGRMRDIVATIQAEQDEVIRAPLEACLIVQGGPGTGKTAVGLHRAAFLLFEHRERLMRMGVLVVGPNRLFLDYIAQVLPTLGERSVRQVTVEGLLGRYRIEDTDRDAAAAVKGDARMAAVIRAGCRDYLSLPNADLEIPFGTRFVRLEAKEIAQLLETAAAAEGPWSSRRTTFREQLLRAAFAHLPEARQAVTDFEEFVAGVLAGPARREIDRWWRTVNATALVRRLLSNRRALARAADGVLTADEQALILRPARRQGERDRWTRFDLPLLDEADAFINGPTTRYGHIVVDEAQDRTAMELRLIGRRATGGSMTVLGDLAQATGVGASTSWDVAGRHLLAPAGVRTVELTVGYRVPASALELANRLLPLAAPGVTPARSAREEGDPPSIVRAAPDALLEESVELGAAFARRFSTTAVIAAGSATDAIVAMLRARDVHVATDDSATLDASLAVLSPAAAKGLEFDAVVVVEPAAIIREEPGGARALFVALTRAVQHLSVLHSEDLPAPLRAGAPS